MNTADEVERFRSAVSRSLGLQLDESRTPDLREALSRAASESSFEAFLSRLESGTLSKDEFGRLVQVLTVGETYFFRNNDQQRAFCEVALPDRARSRAQAAELQILSAGCASGDEASSLAILLREQPGLAGMRIVIHAFDINPAALARARQGIYSEWALRETPAAIRQRWFREEDGRFLLDPAIRSMVTLEERSLTRPDPGFWQPGRFDVVYCRNVLMYLTPSAASEAVARIALSLAPGGYLFLGHAETLRGISQDFHLRHTHGTFYYQRKEVLGQDGPQEIRPLGVPELPRPLLAVVETSGSWADAIQQAAERIRTLTDTVPPPPAPPDAGGRIGEMERVRELLARERFVEALDLLGSFSPGAARENGDALLLRAALLTHRGSLGEAEAVCAALLARDEMNAGAHYLMALCREGVGDRQGAIEQDLAASYLDHSFAMPRLHLGLLARRAGAVEDARRDLEQALLLLQREDPSRLLLFGGGFGREALLALCRAELLACGRTT